MAALTVDVQTKVGDFLLDVRFDVTGGTAAVLGASGAGKTLTLRSIAGLVRPQAGTIVLGGRTLFDATTGVRVATRHRRLGYVFQEYALFPHMPARGNLAYGLTAWTKEMARHRVAELVTMLGLEGLEDRHPNELSGGERQRVALGRALAPAPELLLLDEPFSALDTPTRIALIEEFQALQERLGFTALLVTHDVAEAYALSTYLVLLSGGNVVQAGPRDEVFHHPQSPEAARLVGVRNLLPGRVIAADGEQTMVEVEGVRLAGRAPHASAVSSSFDRLRMNGISTARGELVEPSSPRRTALGAGDAVTVGIRPEDIAVRPGFAPDPQKPSLSPELPATLVQATDRGTRRRLLLALRGDGGAGPQLHVETDQAAGPLSSEWTVVVPPGAVHVWPRG